MECMEQHLDALRQQPLFSWMPLQGLNLFQGCFDLTVQELPAGSSSPVQNKIGCLLQGEASLQSDRASRRLLPGELFGAALDSAGVPCPEDGTLAPSPEGCTVVWMEFDILRSVCYRACWFHARFVQEVLALLNRQSAPARPSGRPSP